MGISVTATEKEIKLAYRKLAIEMHPDKNTDDPDAMQKFIKITQSYNALLDPVGRENYLKYGNPDGPKPFHIGIPMPSFMQKEEYRTLTLSIFFVLLLVVIPGGGWWIYNALFKYNKHQVLSGNDEIFENMLHETEKLDSEETTDLLSNAEEFKEKKFSQETNEESKEINEIQDKLNSKSINVKDKVQILINAYRNNIQVSPKLFESKQKDMLLLIPRLLSCLEDIAASPENCKHPIITEILKFSQMFCQGLTKNDSPYLQLPEFTEKMISDMKLTRTSFKDFIEMSKEQRKEILKELPQEKIAKIESAIAAMPKITLNVKSEVKGSEGIYEGDMLSMNVQLEITRDTPLQDPNSTDEAPFLVHSNKYPFSKQEIIWIIVISEKDPRKFNCVKLNRKTSNWHKEFPCLIINVFFIKQDL